MSARFYHFIPVVFIATSVFLLGLFGSTVNEILLYKRDLINAGQLWRLMSGCFVHLGLYHTILNLTGFAFWYVLFARRYKSRFWLALLFGIAFSNGIFLYLFSPNIDYYAGLSGSLHGLILFSLILESRKDKLNILFSLALIGKIIYEQLPGYDVNYLQEHMHAPVVVDAHMFGAIIGAVLGIICLVSTLQRLIYR